ncbi:FMN-binding negative transcriptional regulator [Sphingomonas elodea]|uniref:FMN-binding negative transcriptional regulator n=1 Tax=Sphingomonas elodea TaxID=179878 RepID=UPI0002630D26|nr:FMN-binding negative transcriptional regulator [Sphingomonas elodea]
MYRPPAFREDRLEVLHAAMLAHPLATLVTGGAEGLMANLVPFTLHPDGAAGVLRAHMARANEQVAQLRTGVPALVIFQGPQAYVSPSWYETKHAHGKVVPTWNYVVVQARGTPTVIEDRDWLRTEIEALTAIHEQDQREPWSVDDAPAAFIAGQLKGIVGIELPIARIEGKWKVSQNQPAANRIGVEQGLRQAGRIDMADQVAARGTGR